MSGGFGRAQGAYDEMVFRAAVRDGKPFYDPLGLVAAGSASDFQTMTNAYLYGTRFFTWLALNDTPEKVVAWMRRDPGSRAYYADQFRQVFGRDLAQAWAEWTAWETRFQQENLARVRQFPLTQGKRLSPRGLGSVSKAYIDSAANALVGGIYYPGVLAHVGSVSLADGRETRLAEIKGPMKYRVTSTAFDAATRTLFYTEDNLALRDLFAIDLATGERRELLHDARIGDLAFNPADRSLWGLRHDNGYVTLVRVPHPYTEFQQVKTLPYAVVPFDLDFSPDGRLLAMSVGEADGAQSLRVFETQALQSGGFTPLRKVDFGQAIPEGFVFAPDGRHLYGSAFYTGISNIYRVPVEGGEFEPVTNAETGLFRPIPQADGSIVALEHTGDGFVPVLIRPEVQKDLGTIEFLGAKLARQRPVVMAWGAGSPDRIDLAREGAQPGVYRASSRMRLQSAYPVVEGYRNTVALGWHADIADPVGLETLGITVSGSPASSLPQRERLHVDVDWRSLQWRVRYRHNHASFYDLFGPTKRSLRGDSLLVGYRQVIVSDEPRRLDFHADAARYTGLATVPGAQAVAASASTVSEVKAGWKYTDTYRSANAVDHESGRRWELEFSTARAGGDTLPGVHGGVDAGLPLPVAHSSFWVYGAAGALGGPRANSLANYYFGAFRNNRVDDGEVKRYRNWDTFPGVPIDDISGQRFGRALFELNLPPLRFESAGTPGFYLSSLRPAVFAGVLRTGPGPGGRWETARNAGAQVDLNLEVMHRLPMTLSVGAARGWRDGGKSSHEWMVSLKILGN